MVIFAAIFLGGALFAALTLQFTADLDFQAAASTVARRVARSVAFRQLCVIACAICLVRFGLNNVLRALAQFSSNPIQWDKSKVWEPGGEDRGGNLSRREGEWREGEGGTPFGTS